MDGLRYKKHRKKEQGAYPFLQETDMLRSFFKIPVIKISFVDFLLQSAIMRFRETCNSREQQKRQLFLAAGNK